ncbi:Kelch motif domain protein [Aspergillus mulundensis]|uniref:Conserved kelch repeat protein TeaB n=1 Tax=Aspergillus mulundensis TaxID=1810919 RepID=A0A3D8SUY5_9EURO|nr:Conserved kelch repeat protein TeaB [Aspergillus mulundensis]RDW90079.1 Conserved kelch repeat protein TeaB [Aspergillus mulundensis]
MAASTPAQQSLLPQTAFLMPASSSSRPQGSADSRPAINKVQGHVPAILVHASVTHCGNDEIYAFGGFDEDTEEGSYAAGVVFSCPWLMYKLTVGICAVYNHVLRLNLKTLRWDLVDNYGDIPGVRLGHTANLYQGHKLVVFGGENEHTETLSDVIIFDVPTATWTQPEVRGHVPRGRTRHAAVIHEDKLFISGGTDAGLVMDDMFYLDLKTWTWSRPWKFMARYDHVAWVWGGRLWTFGGLGPDLGKSTDIWWLDLQAIPAPGTTDQQGTMDPPGRVGSTTHNLDNTLYGNMTPQLHGRSGSYAANSTSVQVRNAGRRKFIAPGPISCLQFKSGPNVPSLSSGTHFQAFASGVLLDLTTPSNTIPTCDCNLSSLELDSLRWRRLVDGQDIFRPGYQWQYLTVNASGTKAWLLGGSLDTGSTPGTGDHNHMSEILSIDLERYGLLGNEMSALSPDPRKAVVPGQTHMGPLSGLGADLSTVFDQPPESGSGADFTITANADDCIYGDINVEDGSLASSTAAFLPGNAVTSSPIHVHKIILQLRWPHFKRLYSAQMVEYHTNRMHIPEPYAVVRAFLYYLYTDSIAGHPEYCADIIDVAGMLVMANIYDLPRLRLLCVNRLGRELDVENAAIIWDRAGRTNEEWLMRRAAHFCLNHWGRVVRTNGFKSLSRQSIIDLCEVADMEGRIIAGPELELVGTLGADDGLGSRELKRSSQLTLNGAALDGDEADADEMDGVEDI